MLSQSGQNQPTPADVASFVSEYMSGGPARSVVVQRTGNVLRDISEAYIAARGLPRADLQSVIALLNSVL